MLSRSARGVRAPVVAETQSTPPVAPRAHCGHRGPFLCVLRRNDRDPSILAPIEVAPRSYELAPTPGSALPVGPSRVEVLCRTLNPPSVISTKRERLPLACSSIRVRKLRRRISWISTVRPESLQGEPGSNRTRWKHSGVATKCCPTSAKSSTNMVDYSTNGTELRLDDKIVSRQQRDVLP